MNKRHFGYTTKFTKTNALLRAGWWWWWWGSQIQKTKTIWCGHLVMQVHT
jgi:hypothetical protein